MFQRKVMLILVLFVGAVSSDLLAQQRTQVGDKVFEQNSCNRLIQQVRDLKFALGEEFVRSDYMMRETRENRSYEIANCAALNAAVERLVLRVLEGESGYSESELAPVTAEQDSPVVFRSCGDPFHYLGTNYATAEAAGRCWFAEPLRALAFSDGTNLEELREDADWKATSSPAWSVYDNVRNHADMAGLLYNGWAATTKEHGGICPAGWHVSRLEDWSALLKAHPTASALKSTDWDGTNDARLNMLPGGFRSSEDGSFEFWGTSATIWTEHPQGQIFSITSGNLPAARTNQPLNTGASIVCVSPLKR